MYRFTHIVVARTIRGRRHFGPFTSEERAADFAEKLRKRPHMENVQVDIVFIRQPKVIAAAESIRGGLL